MFERNIFQALSRRFGSASADTLGRIVCRRDVNYVSSIAHSNGGCPR